MTKCNRQLVFKIPPGAGTGVGYVDVAESLSMVNRKLFKQGMVYGIESIEFVFAGDPATIDLFQISAKTAGDTWSVHNAHTKGEALFNEMQELVLEDNPSVKGTWADYKVLLDGDHADPAVSNLQPLDGDGNPYQPGEWNYSTYVMPQHNVDGAGNPLPADETHAHLLGPNRGVAGAFTSVGLVMAYQQSRATVQPEDPAVPLQFQDSFFNLLTDSGSQEPELALVIIGENDQPPYDQNEYPGGTFNAPVPCLTEIGTASLGFPNGHLSSFVAQCGLIEFNAFASLNGASVERPDVIMIVNVMPGAYKGVAAIPMGQ